MDRNDIAIERFVDYDATTATVESAYEVYDELRAKCPVAHSKEHGGNYMLTRHADVRKAALDWQSFSSAQGVLVQHDPSRPRIPALEHDPPEHAAWRKLYLDAVSPAVLKAIAPAVETIADDLIDRFADKGQCNLTSEFAQPLPILGICAVIGLDRKPDEVGEIAAELLISVADPAASRRAHAMLGEFILGELHSRREAPQNDYLTRIAFTEINGQRLTDHELSQAMIGFLLAGHESTTSSLANLLFHVLSRPDLKKRIREDDKALAAAIEEAVRLTSPFHAFARTTTVDVDVGDVSIPQNERVKLCWAAANRDPAVYQDPAAFDIDRPSNPHLGFGAGRHICVGAPFARLEMHKAVRRLLARLPDISVSQPRLEFDFPNGALVVPKRLEAHFSSTS